MLLLCAAVAQDLSESPETPDPPDPPVQEDAEPEVFTIEPIDVPLPSATRRLSELDSDVTLEDLGLDPEVYDRPALIRGAWFVRPQLSYQRLIREDEGGGALRLGAWAGRRWWTLEALPVQLAADVGLRATAPVGQGRGHRVEALGHIGPWLGPVRIELGLLARWEAESWRKRSVILKPALQVGPEVGIGFDADVVRAYVGVTPVWNVAGDRAKSRDSVLPRLGDETSWRAGLAVPIQSLVVGVDTSYRDTEIGGFFEAGLSMQLAIGGGG